MSKLRKPWPTLLKLLHEEAHGLGGPLGQPSGVPAKDLGLPATDGVGQAIEPQRPGHGLGASVRNGLPAGTRYVTTDSAGSEPVLRTIATSGPSTKACPAV